jgi:hypothetical protein
MLVPGFGPTINVIACSLRDGGSAEAVGRGDWAVASEAAHKPTKLLRRSGAIGFWYGSATTVELERVATILDIYPSIPLCHSSAARSRHRIALALLHGPP